MIARLFRPLLLGVVLALCTDGCSSDEEPAPSGPVCSTRASELVEAVVPGALAEVAFMMKDSKRFPKTNGWGYATFQYDAAKDTWTAKGDNPEFVNACHACHTVVRARDYVFTDYPKR